MFYIEDKDLGIIHAPDGEYFIDGITPKNTIELLQEQIIERYLKLVEFSIKINLERLGYNPEDLEGLKKQELTKSTHHSTQVDSYFINGELLFEIEPIIKPFNFTP